MWHGLQFAAVHMHICLPAQPPQNMCLMPAPAGCPPSLQVVAPKACTLCVVVGGGSRPPLVPRQAKCVKEEWLLQAAERFEQPPMEEFAIE